MNAQLEAQLFRRVVFFVIAASLYLLAGAVFRPASVGTELEGLSHWNLRPAELEAGDPNFPAPTFGAEGRLGRNTYDNSGYNNMNFDVEKFFSVPWFFGEKMKFEARGEFINLFNRVNLINASNNMTSGNFGQATGQLSARYIQIQLRASF